MVMDLWVTERGESFGVTLKVEETLYHHVSPFQTIDIVETAGFGRMLLLDGLIMTTERDEFIYHEMISHIPMLAHPEPKRVLVIGGGDGGTVREVLKHPTVESVVLCEIDGDVIESCRKYLPAIAGKLDDPRVDIQVRDGVAYMEEVAQDPSQHFDVILIDSTDPLGPGVGLFTETFYRNVLTSLKENGVMAAQSESPFDLNHAMTKVHTLLGKVFPIVEPYVAWVPTYPNGYWSWTFCSRNLRPLENVNESEALRIEKTTRFYNRAVHEAVFALPNFVKDALKAGVPVWC